MRLSQISKTGISNKSRSFSNLVGVYGGGGGDWVWVGLWGWGHDQSGCYDPVFEFSIRDPRI